MYIEPIRRHVELNSELACILEEMDEKPFLLEKDGELYRLVRETDDDIWARYDLEKVKAALKKTAGSWADIDVDELIADIYQAC